MATTASIFTRAIVNDGTNDLQRFEMTGSTVDVVGESGKRETITLGAAFTALSPPVGVTAVIIKVVSGAASLTLKGVTGDTGIAIQTAGLTTCPAIVMPLGTSPSIGILSTGIVSLDVLWI